MKIADIIAAIEKVAAPALQEEYDNAGLITGSHTWNCAGCICTLDVTMDVLKEAKDNKCNLIVAHHPIIFRGLKQITGKNYVEQIIIEAIKNDIAIYAVHTNLDNVVEGVNGMIVKKLGLTNIAILQPKPNTLRKLITYAPVDKAQAVRQALFDAGGGHIGNYAECSFNSEGTGTFKAGNNTHPYIGEKGEQHQERETKIEMVFPFYLEKEIVKALKSNHPYEEVAYDIFSMENAHAGIGSGIIGELPEPVPEKTFLKMLKDCFQANGIRHTALQGKLVKRVAACGGAGSFLIRQAIRQKADVYITGDVKYHEFFDAEESLVLADIGHYESEQYTIDLMYDLLLKKFPNFAVLKTSVNTNPIHYFTE